MIQVLAALLAVFGLFLLLRSLWIRSGLSRRQTWMTIAAASIVVVLIGLAATGRTHWLVAAGAALLPFARRALGLLRFAPLLNHLFPGWQQRFARQQHGGTNTGSGYATTQTAHLRMSLHQASGHIDGEVLTGSQRGRLLSELGLADILALHGEFDDNDSKRLIETYLDRSWPDWRSSADPDSGPDPGSDHGSDHGHGGQAGTAQAGMDRARALEVLGLTDAASREEIVSAHRRLMQRLHPDRGGSTYLAATLNEAKQVLLGS